MPQSQRPFTLGAQDCLLVVDVQNDFCEGGALGVPDGQQVVPLVNALAPRFAQVVLSQDWHPPGHASFASSHPGRKPFEEIDFPYGKQTLWPDHCVQGSEGAEFHPDLDLRPARLIVRKGFHQAIDSYSTFYENDRKTPTGLSGYLREIGVQRLFFAGLATDFCVHYSVLDALAEGFQAFVIEDACRAIDLEGSLAAAWDEMLTAGAQRIRSPGLLAA